MIVYSGVEGIFVLYVLEMRMDIKMDITQEELNKKVEQHSKWLQGEEGGERLILNGVDLEGANLKEADLYDANLKDTCLEKYNFNKRIIK